MNSEMNRVASFATSDLKENINVGLLSLARLGFFYNNDRFLIECYNCGFRLDKWESNEEVMERHKQNSPNCDVANGTPRNNLALRPLKEEFDRNHSSNGHQPLTTQQVKSVFSAASKDHMDCEIQAERQNDSEFTKTCRQAFNRAMRTKTLESFSRPVPAINPEKPDYDQLRREKVRLGTFTNWPMRAHARPADLARNGFFYMGTDDRVQCAYCHGFLKNWVPGDDPGAEHKKHFSSCPFVRGIDVGNVTEEADCFGDYATTAARTIQPV